MPWADDDERAAQFPDPRVLRSNIKRIQRFFSANSPLLSVPCRLMVLEPSIVTSNDETTAATPQRIDLKKMRKISDELFDEDDISDDLADVFNRFLDLLNELEKMYAREDELLGALRIVRDDLDEAIAQGHLPITSTDGIDATKIRNFANDASQ